MSAAAPAGPAAQIGFSRPDFPYPGLRPFEPEEWSIFFGREEMIDDVIDRLARQRFVLIHGASGSGKSSLVRAGILPKLARQHLRRGAAWQTCAMRPSGGPLWNLAAEFARLEGRGGDLGRRGEIIRLFNRQDATLGGVAAQLDGLAGRRLCLLVDQFEEVFRFERESSREEAELFIDLLIGAIPEEPTAEMAEPGPAAPPGADLHIILTMRSEFLGDCARFDRFAEAVNRTQYLVPRLTRAALVRAIRQPARLFGGAVTAELAERLIADARGKLDELPLIQHGLMQFWYAARRAAPGAAITLDAALLDHAGGLGQLLSDHADEVMGAAAASEPQKRAVEHLFRALTDINADGQAIRRPVSFAALVQICAVPADTLLGLIDAFRAEGVSFLTPYAPAPITDKTIIDISHEALIRCWRAVADRKEGWLRQEFDDGLVWRSLLMEAQRFEADRSRLLSPATTVERQSWVKGRTAQWSERYGGNWLLVARLLRASRKGVARSRRSWRVFILVLAVLAVIGILESTQYYGGFRYSASLYLLAFASLITLVSWIGIELIVSAVDRAQGILSIARRLIRDLSTTLSTGAPARQITRHKQRPPKLDHVAWNFFNKYAYLFLAGGAVLVCDLAFDRDANFLRERAEAVYKQKSYSMALALYREAARQGDPAATYQIGLIYEDGIGIAKDYGEAAAWYRKSADGGYAPAETATGNLYYYGKGVAQDYTQAMAWYQKAANQGDARAQYNIGLLYHYGRGVAQDYAQAMTWYGKAAAQDYAPAEFGIGALYYYGNGVAQDYGQAMLWLRKAADQGDATAQNYIGSLYYNGEGVSRDYGQAMVWFRKAADQGDAAAQDNIGNLYHYAKGLPQDYGQAMAWYRKAADQDYADAKNNIGSLYDNGEGVPQDYTEAMAWYRLAADQGYAAAQNNIGILYEDGKGVSPDDGQELAWYRKAADQGDAAGLYHLGSLYDRGLGVPADPQQALEWMRKAADAGEQRAKDWLAAHPPPS